MTKQEVLRSIDSLIRDLNKWTGKRVKASLDRDDNAYREAMFELEGLASDANQELTYLRDYIEENVKENSMTDKEKPIEEMTQEEARAAGRWLEWWGAIQKELASKQREHNMFVNNRPIRS